MARRIMALSSGSAHGRPLQARHRWDEIALEKITEMMSQKIVAGEREMLAQTYLKRARWCRMHAHASEQMTYVLQGALRFVVGGEEIIVREGEVLHIPAGSRIRPRRSKTPSSSTCSARSAPTGPGLTLARTASHFPEQTGGPPRPSKRLRSVMMKTALLLVVAALSAASLAACEIRVGPDEGSTARDVDVDTPLGDLTVRGDAVPADVGVAVYPGRGPSTTATNPNAPTYTCRAPSWTCESRR